MSARPLAPIPKTYAQLRDAVKAVVVQGRQAIDRAWLETYHETGRLINEHILLFRDRADYGAKTYEKLAADTGISKRSLQECAQFHRYYPIARHVAPLGWNRCRLLCQVEDQKRRDSLTTQAIKHDWSSGEISERVRSHNAIALASADPAPAAAKSVELLSPRCGVPGLLRVVARPDGLGLDLGFKNYAALPATTAAAKWKAGDIVRWDTDGVRKIPDATPAQLFTYTATVRKIVDGDTLDIAIALAPGFTRDLRLRLRGLDCPELETAAGRAAQAYVETLLAVGDTVTVCTTKPDKYDRYLADVFVGESRAESPESRDRNSSAQLSALGSPLTADRSPLTAEGPTFLNNALLSSGHAIRYDGGAKEM